MAPLTAWIDRLETVSGRVDLKRAQDVAEEDAHSAAVQLGARPGQAHIIESNVYAMPYGNPGIVRIRVQAAGETSTSEEHVLPPAAQESQPMSTVLTTEDVRNLRTGAHFLTCTIDPTAIYIYAEMIQRAMEDRSLELITVDELAPDDLVVAVGMVTQGLFIADMPPVGDEFLGCIRAIEASLGRSVRAIYSLAAANINGIVPLMVGLQSSLPVIDSDPMGRVFPLISQTTLNIGNVAIGPIALMGVTGERAVVEVESPQRAETLVRALVTELGGWAATAMYPCSAQQLKEHGVHGSISRMIRIGQILELEHLG